MREIIIIISSISIIAYIFHWYILMGTKHFEYTFKNQNRLFLNSLYISVLLSICAIIIVKYQYNEIDPLMMLISIFGISAILIKIIFKGKKNKLDKEIIEIKKDDYEIISEVDTLGVETYTVNSYMKLKRDYKDSIVIFNITPPNEKKDLIMEVEKHIEKDIEYYLCTNYMYKKIKKLEWINLLFNIYVALYFVYGYTVIATKDFYIMHQQLSDENGGFIAGPILYLLGNFGFKTTRNGGDSFTKFIHFICGIMYIFSIIFMIMITLNELI